MDYENIEKSKLFSIEKRSRTLKCLLDTLHLKWYSYEGFIPKQEYPRKVRTLLNKWNRELEKTENSEHDHVELAITKINKNVYSVWVQRSENNKIIRTRPMIFRGPEVFEILPVFSSIGVFNELGEWIWV